MLLVEFKLCGFGIKRGSLFGKGKIPITAIKLGLFSILRTDIRALNQFGELLEHGLSIDNFTKRHYEAVAKLDIWDEVVTSYSLQHEKRVKDLKDSLAECRKEVQNLRSGSWHLREAFKILKE